ncbi:HutD family protein [Brevibacterium sp. 50QC2O2]|uniref:HutD family protein n=1 Tax=Brevibacterium TaxID=1696 RepID=UPI00211BA5F5|nr:HutD family protein [Brevibacterium sp. 91QC2O2]MCQ9386211.1 HutD family protein [Brevibacterium sp. 68QC2CO]MCQ9388598.1 HutD family protein [Brevibacterium sp. 50QC2O2]
MIADGRAHPARRFAELAGAPWANGAGTTTELIGYAESSELPGPPSTPVPGRAGRAEASGRAEVPAIPAVASAGAAPLQWRLSVAELLAPAPFSALPGVARTFVAADGPVVLSISGRRTAVAPGRAVRFSGSEPVELLALERPCHAVNLMVRSASGQASARGASGLATSTTDPGRTTGPIQATHLPVASPIAPGLVDMHVVDNGSTRRAVVTLAGHPIAEVSLDGTFDLYIPAA